MLGIVDIYPYAVAHRPLKIRGSAGKDTKVTQETPRLTAQDQQKGASCLRHALDAARAYRFPQCQELAAAIKRAQPGQHVMTRHVETEVGDDGRQFARHFKDAMDELGVECKAMHLEDGVIRVDFYKPEYRQGEGPVR